MKYTKIIFIVGMASMLFWGCAKKQTVVPSDVVALSTATVAGGDDNMDGITKAINEVNVVAEPDIRDKEFKTDRALKTVYFEYDKSTLSPEARDALKQDAQWMQQNQQCNLLVEGHADERGTTEYNLALGQERATVVRTYLVYLGVPAQRIGTISYGKERPAVTGETETSWAKNRRAEVEYFQNKQ